MEKDEQKDGVEKEEEQEEGVKRRRTMMKRREGGGARGRGWRIRRSYRRGGEGEGAR